MTFHNIWLQQKPRSPGTGRFFLLTVAYQKTAAASLKEKISLQNSAKLEGMSKQESGEKPYYLERVKYLDIVSGTLSVHDSSTKK